MKKSFKKGFSFGLTSAILTVLGLIVGLATGTKSKLAVVGGILTIAIADSFSDALGIHISEEADKRNTQKQVWTSTFSTLATKFIIALTFLIPILLFNLSTAVVISSIWGFLLISLFSYRMAKNQKRNPLPIVGEHLLIGILIVILTYFVGRGVSVLFS